MARLWSFQPPAQLASRPLGTSVAVDDAWRHLRTQRAPPTTLSASPEATTSSAPSFFDMRCCWGCVMGSPVKQGKKLGLKGSKRNDQ